MHLQNTEFTDSAVLGGSYRKGELSYQYSLT